MQNIHHLKLQRLKRTILERRLARKNALLVIPLAIICYVIAIVTMGLRKHELFRTTAWDLGVFTQAFDSTIHSTGFFAYTLEPFTNPSGSFFGVHFSPILIAILPIYAAYPSIGTLLVVQALALALGAVPVYYLSLSTFGKVRSSIAVALVYLLYFPMHAANLFDFHVESFVVTPMLCAIYYLQTRQWKKLAVSVILALSTIEYAAFMIAAIGIAYLLLNAASIGKAVRLRKFRDSSLLLPGMLCLVAAGWFLGARQALSFFNPSPPASFEGAQSWSLVGAGSIAEIPGYLLLHPANGLRAVEFDLPLKLLYVVFLLAPILFVPVLRPTAFLAALPWLGLAFLSNYAPFYQIGFQYPLFVVPGIFWALILGMQRLESLDFTRRLRIIQRNMPRILIVSSMVGLFVFAGLTYPITLTGPMQHVDYLNRIIQLVPPGSTVVTQNNLFTHFSDRFTVYAIPIYLPSWSTNFRQMIDLTFGRRPDFILVDGVTDPHSGSIAALWLRENGGYGVFASSDGIILLKRSFEGTPSFYVPIKWTLDQSNLTIQGGRVLQDSGAASGASLYHSANSITPEFWVGPSGPLILPPGRYNLTLNLKTGTVFKGDIILVSLRAANGTEALSTFKIGGISSSESWTSFTFDFPLQHAESVWLNASSATSGVDIYLNFIQLVQLTYLSP